NRCFARRVVVIRNHYEIRHLRKALRDVSVELAIETGGVRTRIFPDFGEEQGVESRPLRAAGATPRFRYKRFVVFRERNRFETEVKVLLNPCLQTACGHETSLIVV